MELIVVIAFILFLSSRNSNKKDVLMKDFPSPDLNDLFDKKNYNSSKNKDYSNQDREDASFKQEDIFFTYDNTIFNEKLWKISGKSALIRSQEGDEYFLFMETGKHSLRDEKFLIEYAIEQHYDTKGQKKMYFNNISVNGIQVGGKVTNKKSAASVLKDISNMTKDAIFDEEAIGNRFFLECAATLLFNEINLNRTLTDYTNMPKEVREKFIQNAYERLNHYVDNLENLYYKESNHHSADINSFDIYLKVMEFQSVNGITYDDIKVQYKKLAKKYHPDSINGDENRFKLILDAFEYLQEYYPK